MTSLRFSTAALIALTLAACTRAPEAPPPIPGAQIVDQTITFPGDSPQLTTLRVVEALPERESHVRIIGRTVWDESRTSRVTSPVAGRVVQMVAAPGALVRKGDPLAIVSSPEFGAAQSEEQKATADFSLAERAAARARELHGAGVIPTKELQAAEADFERARAERDRTLAKRKLYGGGTSIDQQFTLVAPIAGVVVERHVTVGQEVRPDTGPDVPSLFVITDPYHLWINLDVPEALSQEVQLGEAVRVAVPALPNVLFPAHVDFIADFIDPQSRTVKARASIGNPHRSLKAEMFVTAEVEIPPSSALKVPATALFLVDRDYHCFVEEAVGKFARRRVLAEEAAIGFMRVKDGLRSGEKVVADGSLLLQRMLTQKASTPAATRSGVK